MTNEKEKPQLDEAPKEAGAASSDSDASLSPVPLDPLDQVALRPGFGEIVNATDSSEEVGLLIDARGKTIQQDMLERKERLDEVIAIKELEHRHQQEVRRLEHEQDIEKERLKNQNEAERHERRFQYFKLAFSFSVFAGGLSLMFLNHEYTGLIIAGGGIAAVAEKYAEKIVDRILSKLLGD